MFDYENFSIRLRRIFNIILILCMSYLSLLSYLINYIFSHAPAAQHSAKRPFGPFLRLCHASHLIRQLPWDSLQHASAIAASCSFWLFSLEMDECPSAWNSPEYLSQASRP